MSQDTFAERHRNINVSFRVRIQEIEQPLLQYPPILQDVDVALIAHSCPGDIFQAASCL